MNIPSRRLENHIRASRPPMADERSEEYREVQDIIKEEFAVMIPSLPESPRTYARTNYPVASSHFETYETFLAQPYRGPIGETWATPELAALDVGVRFSWLPFIVGTLVITDIKLIAIKDDVIAHLDREIGAQTVYVDRSGFDGIATTDVFSYDFDNPQSTQENYPINLAYTELTLADVVGNHWRYEFDEIAGAYVACSERQAKRNWLKGRSRYLIGRKVGDDAARIADLSRLVNFLLSVVQDQFPPEVQTALAALISDVPDTPSLERVAGRHKAVNTILSEIGYPNVSRD